MTISLVKEPKLVIATAWLCQVIDCGPDSQPDYAEKEVSVCVITNLKKSPYEQMKGYLDRFHPVNPVTSENVIRGWNIPFSALPKTDFEPDPF